MDYSPPCSSVHGILQARIMEWVAISTSGDLPNPEIEPMSLTSPALVGGFFTISHPYPLATTNSICYCENYIQSIHVIHGIVL